MILLYKADTKGKIVYTSFTWGCALRSAARFAASCYHTRLKPWAVCKT